MSSVYDIGNEVSFGNHSNDSILAMNREIRLSNQRAKQAKQDAVVKAQSAVAGLQTKKGEAEDVGSAIIGNIAGGGQTIKTTAKVAKKVAAQTLQTVADLIEPEDSVFRQIRITGSETLGDTENVSRSLVPTLQAGDDVVQATAVGEDAVKGAGDLGDALKVGGQALAVGMGALDGIEDISSGKIVGNNTAEKVSNVAGIASGVLEGAGLALDATGVGAPVGVALNVLGGIAGLVGAGADIVGEEEEKKSAQDAVKAAQAAPVKQQAQMAVQDVGSAGVELR
jgi:hypothetical protein